MQTTKWPSNFWADALNINELTVTLENISADDKRPLENYSVTEVVAEAEYVLSTFYEPGHINGDTYAGEYEHDQCNQAWAASEVRKLKAFIKKYKRVKDLSQFEPAPF